MCRAVKPLVNEDIYRLKDADENCSEQNSPKDFITINENDTKQHQKQDISVESYSWNCEHCGCSNPNRRPASLICRQCGTYKSMLASKPCT